MTGWGQEGPISHAAGHDINYIALTGSPARGRHAGWTAPFPALNLIGDFGGGGLYLAFGMVCGLLETQRSGKGPGGGRGHDRRLGLPHDHGVRDVRGRGLGGRARDTTRSTAGATSTRCTRLERRQARVRSAPSRTSSTPSCSSGRGWIPTSLPAQFDRKEVAERDGALRGCLPDEDPRRVVRDHGRKRRLLRAGAIARARRRPILTTGRGIPSWRWTASSSPRRRPDSAAPCPNIQRPPAAPRRAHGRSARATGDSPRTRYRRPARPGGDRGRRAGRRRGSRLKSGRPSSNRPAGPDSGPESLRRAPVRAGRLIPRSRRNGPPPPVATRIENAAR